MSDEADYSEFCPDKDEDIELFSRMSADIVASYQGDPPPARDVEAELRQLRGAIGKLSPFTREVIEQAEIYETQTPGVWDEAWRKEHIRVRDGGGALHILERLLEGEYEPEESSSRGLGRAYLIMKAVLVYSAFGGVISAAVNAPFHDYTQRIFLDCGLDEADCGKAIARFLERNPGVLSFARHNLSK